MTAVMATKAEQSPTPEGKLDRTLVLEDAATPWVEYGLQQAHLLQDAFQYNLDPLIERSRSRLSQIMSTSSAHLRYTLDSLEDVKNDYAAYEDAIFGKIREGVVVGASHPLLMTGAVAGLGLIALKRPRRFLYYKTVRLLMTEESMLSRAEAKVQELRKSIDQLKAESEKLERDAKIAEEIMIHGRTKLRQAGKQIQGVIQSAYKIERQARGLKYVLDELPRREASRFKSQVSSLTSEAKQEKSVLSKEISKISNYGISV